MILVEVRSRGGTGIGYSYAHEAARQVIASMLAPCLEGLDLLQSGDSVARLKQSALPTYVLIPNANFRETRAATALAVLAPTRGAKPSDGEHELRCLRAIAYGAAPQQPRSLACAPRNGNLH